MFHLPRTARARGQAAPLAAILLVFLAPFTLLVMELAERQIQVAMVEDALQQATRSAVQTLDYQALARGQGALRAGAGCAGVRWDDRRCRAVLEVARRFLITNLAGARGLAETPEQLADRVRWTVLPAGGTCSFSPPAPPVSAPTALLCAEVRPTMGGFGLAGWGQFTPLIIAADTLDHLP